MRIHEIAQSRVRYGYRKIRVLPNREGWDVGKYLVLSAVQGRGSCLEETAPAQEESSTAPGRALHRHSAQPGMEHRLRRRSVARWQARFRALTILDVYTREDVAIEAGQSLKEKTWCAC